jgi:hypothetical protein
MSFASDRLGEMSFTIPQEGIRSSASPSNARSTLWTTSVQPFTAIEAPTIETLGATLSINVPTSGPLLGLALAGISARRRRR